MYFIIGGDGRQYGPISADDMRKWIAEGRLNAQSQAKAESDADFRPLGGFPEFVNALAAHAAAAGRSPGATTATDWETRDYQLDIGGCVSRGWQLFKDNFGVLFVAVLLFGLIEGLIAGFGSIPLIGPLFSLANLFVVGPLTGGVYYVFLQTIRQQPANAGDVFAGFRKAFLHLFLGKFVTGLLAGLCMIPFVIVVIILAVKMAMGAHGQTPEDEVENMRALLMALLPVGLPVFLICLVPAIYLQVRWVFTLPLVIDRQLDFWTAMKLSWKMVGKHWWQVFGLIILVGLLNLAGLCACCVGALFTAPIGYGALMYAYETIFSPTERAAG